MWSLRGGRGSGKTRPGAEDISQHARRTPTARVALVAPTFGDARDIMVEGESGLLSVVPESALRGGTRDGGWNRSMGELWFANGAQAKCYSSEKPARLRGPQFTRAWVEEPGTWADTLIGPDTDRWINSTFNTLSFALRLGDNPQMVVTGTPKTTALVRYIDKLAEVKSLMSTYENLDNLSPQFQQAVLDRYKGTRLERQEIFGEFLEDVEGALFLARDILYVEEAPQLVRVVIGVDPAGSDRPGGAETGIIAAGVGIDGRYYVLGDHSLRSSPERWGAAVGTAYDVHSGDRIATERNFGGDMVAATVRLVRPDLKMVIKDVNASRGKTIRAEPIAALYEQGKVSHVGPLPFLETQMTTWVQGDPSPDRVDALVWALTELLGRRRVPLRTNMGPMSVVVPRSA